MNEQLFAGNGGGRVKQLYADNGVFSSFHRVFEHKDPFSSEGVTSLPIRVVLFPTDGYHLTETQFNAMKSAAKAIDETYFYVCETEVEYLEKANTWLCDSPTYAEYSSVFVGIENAVFSADSHWGLIISHELHALLVCNDVFWENFRRAYPTLNKDYLEFVEYWEENEAALGSNIDWLKPFLQQLTSI